MERKIIREFDLKGNKFNRKATVIKEIAIAATIATLEDEKIYALAGGVGLMQGLKYNGSFSRGAKAGLATMAVTIGANVTMALVRNINVIKEV